MTNIKLFFGNWKRLAWSEDDQDSAGQQGGASKQSQSEFSAPRAKPQHLQGRREGVCSAHDRIRTLACAVLGGALCLLFVGTAVSSAQAASPWWHLTIGTRPAVLPSEPGAKGQIIVTAANLGDETANGGTGSPVTIVDSLPIGLKATAIKGVSGGNPGAPANRGLVNCSLASLTCTFADTLPPYDPIEVLITVRTEEGAASPLLNQATVSGGGALSTSLSRPLALAAEPPPFGIENYELIPEEEGGAPDTQAGSHPFQLTTTITTNQTAAGLPVALAKDLHVNLPPGLVGNLSQIPRCTLAKFNALNGSENECPPQSAIGVTMLTIEYAGVQTVHAPVFNLEPAHGEPARFGFIVVGSSVVLDTSVRSGGDYGATVSVDNIPQSASLLSSLTTVWGVPNDPRHDNSRGYACLAQTRGLPANSPCNPTEAQHPPALLTLPTSCTGAPLQSTVEAKPWTLARLFQTFTTSRPLPTLDGCNRLPFAPTIDAEPTSDAATSPTGLNFDLDVSDEGLINSKPGATAQSQIKKAVVTLPEGFTTNPSVAEGLHACSEAQYESEIVNSAPGAGCPNESKVGDVEIESPLVEGKKVIGSLYVARQHENPYHNLLTLYLVARNPEIGVIVKQALEVKADPLTGQLTTTVDDIPQLPFSHFELSFRQGQRSPLITPPACGTYTVTADLYPYSNPTVPLHDESSFQITKGPEGLPCPSGNTPPFHPNLEAGTINNRAGSYSPFYTHITRRDSEQEITHFSIKLPPGVAGILAGIPFCPEAGIAQAEAREHEGGGDEEEAAPSCPAASEVGHTLVGSGVGNVLAYAPGKFYLAGPYHGSKLSFVSITAAKVGPFDLGTVVVRFALRVDPETAEVFVDAQGSDPIPHIVDGIPVHLRDIRGYIDRPQFTYNPTSCKKTFTASTLLGSGLDFGSAADDVPVTVSSPFQVGSCASLKFKPKLKLSLKGSTKRGGNPALKAVLTYPYQPSANIASAQVTLPPSEFLDNAHIGTVCTRVQFKEGNVPGEKCPAASIYGFAKAVTPVFSEPLEGPVFLRSSSHELPDLLAALHNNEVDIALAGHTEGVHGGIRNTFEAVPDAPVTSFTLELKGAKKGLLQNSTNLCLRPHRADAVFTGHNGKVFESRPVLSVKCKKGGGGKKRHRRHGG